MDVPSVMIRRSSAGGYDVSASFDEWRAGWGCLNEFVHGLRVSDYERDVGASKTDLRIAMEEMRDCTMPQPDRREWVMTSTGESALEAAVAALIGGEWIRPEEFHPRLGVEREQVASLATALSEVRQHADRESTP